MEGRPQVEELITSIAQRHASDPRRALTAARELSDELAVAGDHVLGHFVAAARDAGVTWTDIGDALGVSKQAAQKRFAVRLAQSPIVIGPHLFSRFDPRLSKALIRATQSARADGGTRVTAEHLLAGIASIRNGRAIAIIRSLAPDFAVSLTTSVSLPATLRRRGMLLPFSTDARAAFSRLESIAEDEGLTTIGTEHLLLALAGEALSDVGARLQSSGVTPAKIQQILT